MLYDISQEKTVAIANSFCKNILGYPDLTKYCQVFRTDDPQHDYLHFELLKPQLLQSYAGTTILPTRQNEQITVLISANDYNPIIVLHELSHVYDFVCFANYYCEADLTEIKLHNLYVPFVYWSEFHTKIIEIIFTQYMIDLSASDPMARFKERANEFYYPTYTSKFLQKKNLSMHDLMWYYGEIYTCKLYDTAHTYNVPEFLQADIHQGFYQDLFTLMGLCLEFQGFVKNAEKLRNLLEDRKNYRPTSSILE